MVLPTQTGSSTHRTRFRAHWVRERMTKRLAKCICSLLLTLILVVGVILFVLWLSLRPHRPRFHLAAFAASGISNQTGLSGSAFSFNVTDRNPNGNIGIYYDVVYGSVYYRDRQIASGSVLFPFYQPPKNTTAIEGQLQGAAVADATAAAQLSADAAAGRVELRLELSSVIRFKVKTWDTHRHHLHVQCYMFVGGHGSLLPESKDLRCPIYF